MYKVNKIQSNESGTFDQNGSICNVKVSQSYGVVDYTKSYMLFNHALIFRSGTTDVAPPLSIHKLVLRNNTFYLPPGAIVKHYNHTSSNGLRTADIRDVNILNANLKYYALDSQEKKLELLPEYQASDESGGASYFNQFVRNGSEPSSYQDYPLKVMLSDLDGYSGFNSSANFLDLNRFGDANHFMELNKNIFTPTEIVPFVDTLNVGGDITQVSLMPINNYTNATGAAVAFGSTVPLVMTEANYNIYKSSLVIGGGYSLEGDNAGTPTGLLFSTLKSITRVVTPGPPEVITYNLEFNTPFIATLANGAALTVLQLSSLIQVSNITQQATAQEVGTVVPLSIPAANISQATLNNLINLYGVYISYAYTGNPPPKMVNINKVEYDVASNSYKIYTNSVIQSMPAGAGGDMTSILLRVRMFKDVSVTANTDVLSLTYNRLLDGEDLPFWVGQQLSFNAKNNGVEMPAVQERITGIAFDNATKLYNLTFAGPIATVAANQSLTEIRCHGVSLGALATPLTVSTTLDKVEMSLYQVMGQKSNVQEVEFIKWESNKFNMSGNSHSDSYMLKPECVNMFLMMPEADLRATPSTVSTYRMRLDNEDLTNRDVNIAVNDRTLHNDRLYMSYNNLRIPFKNLNSLAIRPEDWNATQQAKQSNAENVLVISNPIPISDNYKQLQVDIQATGNLVSTGILYTANQNVIKL
jgi:hypothetical protein